MKYLPVLFLLAVVAQSAYTPKTALEMGYMSAVAYNSIASIQAWTCPECSKYKVTDIKAFINATGDIQGFVGYSATHNAAVVAFRGSVDTKNWILNGDFRQSSYPKCSGCLIHDGFYKAYLEISGVVKNQIQVIRGKYSTSGIYVTGHSLGGAIAVIAALDIKATFSRLDVLYTYGQPRVGNTALANYIASQVPLERVVHYADIVPHLPPLNIDGYLHGGQQIWYAEDMQTYKTCTAEDKSCMDSLAPSQLNTQDHDLSKYLKLPASMIQMFNLRRYI